MTTADMPTETNQGRLTYDPNSPAEQPVPLPSAPAVPLALKGCVLQPPLSRRGIGPGLVVIRAPRLSLRPHASKGLRTPLDPDPVQKWAEEGFGVVGVKLGGDTDVQEALGVALAALEQCPAVNSDGRYGVLVYDPSALEAVLAAMATLPMLVCLVSHGSGPSYAPVPALAHIPERIRGDAESLNSFDDGAKPPGSMLFGNATQEPPQVKMHAYPAHSAYFVIPSAGPGAYSPTDAALAHSRSLMFLRRYLGGPHFDLEEIWDEHTHWEFVDRSVAKTMSTMVAEPYVNHIPTMTGGVGREELTAFYRDHFIFSNPRDADITVVSRTVGADRVVDEFVYSCTHNQEISWLLPQVPPSGNKLEIPMVAVVNFRGDRLFHEHIWWDQATALQQAGVLPGTVPVAGGNLRLPVGGRASTKMFVDETSGQSNAMLGSGWGVQATRN